MTRRIYHITHIDNLASIIEAGGLSADCRRRLHLHDDIAIANPSIKERRRRLQVHPHPQTVVGDYVPFYFCPRSVMLFVLHKANHPDVKYKGGQRPIVHLSAKLENVVAWAEKNDVRWAFSFGNAATTCAEMSCDATRLDDLPWGSIAATDFRNQDVKEAKQSEFLTYGYFPFELFDEIGVLDGEISEQVLAALDRGSHRPTVRVRRDWYY